MKLSEVKIQDALDTLPVHVEDHGDTFISTCEGVDHESWGDTAEEARTNFITSLRWMRTINESASFASLFSDRTLLERYAA